MYDLLVCQKNKISVGVSTGTQYRGGHCGNLITGDGSRGQETNKKETYCFYQGRNHGEEKRRKKEAVKAI